MHSRIATLSLPEAPARCCGAAGVGVEGDVLASEAQTMLKPWLHRVASGRPHVTWKFAAIIDGRVAAADRTSRWITGQQARADVPRMAAPSRDAVGFQQQLRLAIVIWIEKTYHRRRRQDTPDRLTPIEFENLHQAAQAACHHLPDRVN